MTGQGVTLKNGERDIIERRFKIPGRNRGFLCICQSGNCYVCLRGVAVWVFDLAEHPTVKRDDRVAVMKVYQRENEQRGVEALAGFMAERLPHLRGKRKDEHGNADV